jgi:eukaryotic-like serine/threonine-protein kinase
MAVLRRRCVESLVGQQLGSYVLEAEIGQGSMGVVYRGHHAQQRHPAAIKVLLDTLATEGSFVTRFTREANIVRTLQHPNIVRLFEAGQDQGHIYFAMEYFAGSTAGHLLRHRGRLHVGQVIEIAAQASDALHYAHTHGHLVHRDIKPENLLVDRWCRVKVLDFGLARVEGLHSITRAGTVVGSLYYVPPEQLLGRQLDGRADVYALGVSMYEMLTGKRPYRGRTLTEMTEAITQGKAEPPSRLAPDIPAALEQVVLRAMACDLEARYATAGDLHNELRALQARLSPGESPPVAFQTAGPIATGGAPLRITMAPLTDTESRGQ